MAAFVVEGIGRGERAVHIVEPARRGEHLDRLAAAGIDIHRALDRNQLDVRGWGEVYLVEVRSEPDRTVRLLKALLDEGRALGYPATRAIGFMEWALEEARGVQTITTYEALLDVALRHSSDAVICAYDVRRHRPAVIADILDIHPYALVEGGLRMRQVASQPRDRILGTAARLFHRHGIGATGIDRVIAEAGVAKGPSTTSSRQRRSWSWLGSATRQHAGSTGYSNGPSGALRRRRGSPRRLRRGRRLAREGEAQRLRGGAPPPSSQRGGPLDVTRDEFARRFRRSVEGPEPAVY